MSWPCLNPNSKKILFFCVPLWQKLNSLSFPSFPVPAPAAPLPTPSPWPGATRRRCDASAWTGCRRRTRSGAPPSRGRRGPSQSPGKKNKKGREGSRNGILKIFSMHNKDRIHSSCPVNAGLFSQKRKKRLDLLRAQTDYGKLACKSISIFTVLAYLLERFDEPVLLRELATECGDLRAWLLTGALLLLRLQGPESGAKRSQHDSCLDNKLLLRKEGVLKAC